MKRKKKPVQVDVNALRKLLKSVSQLSESEKLKIRNTAAATLAVIIVFILFGPIVIETAVRAFNGSW